MKSIVHLSDLHFGTEHPHLVEGLLSDLDELNPTLVAISGDLTQRARLSQFAAARTFLSKIRQPVLVVPGNHDLPLHNVWRRFWRPLAAYRQYITDELAPAFIDDTLMVVGLNTARSTTWKNGRISHAQIRHLRSVLCDAPPTLFKVLVAHHPFLAPPHNPKESLVGRRSQALQVAEACGTDLILAGHLHVGYSGDVRAGHALIRRSILVAHAGTAVSRRTRRESNAYNVIRIDPPSLAITVRAWTGDRFAPMDPTRYQKVQGEWRKQTDGVDQFDGDKR